MNGILVALENSLDYSKVWNVNLQIMYFLSQVETRQTHGVMIVVLGENYYLSIHNHNNNIRLSLSKSYHMLRFEWHCKDM